MTIIERLAQWSHALSYDDIPVRVRDKARLQLFSVLGAIHASARHEIGQKVHAAVGAWAGDGPCTIIPTGRKVDLLSAVFANTALSVALDYDDYLLFGHTGHSAVCVSLALAERQDADSRLALAAQVVANEIEGRMGAAVMLGPHNGQGWSHIHLAGAAAAAARVLGLSAEVTAHAMAISLYQPTYLLWPGFMGPDSKAATAASPSVIGVQSALLAAAGATGPLDVIEHPQGYLARLSYVPAPFYFSGLGRAWVTDTLAYKIYPGCAYIDTAVDAALALRADFQAEEGRALDPAEIEDILVEATALTVEMDALSKSGGSFDPLNPVSINFSIPGNVALAILHGRLSADDLRRERLLAEKDAVLALARKVRLRHDVGLTVRFLQAIDRVLGIDDIAGRISLAEFARFRRRSREQYQSDLGLSFAELRQAWSDPEVRARLRQGLISRLAAVARPPREFDLGERKLENFSMPFAARLTITLKGGKKLCRTREIPLAGPGNPPEETRELVLLKYTREAGINLGESRARELVDAPAETLTARQILESSCRQV